MRRFPSKLLPGFKKGVLLALVLFCGCHAPENEGPSRSASAPLPDQELWGWATVVTKEGRKRARVRADHLVRTDKPEQSLIDGHVGVVFFDAQGDTASTLTAQRGQIDSRGDHMSVFGQVVVRSQDSTRLETDSLRWNRDPDRIVGDGRVRIVRPDGMETGVGFDASSDLKRWTLKQVLTTQSK